MAERRWSELDVIELIARRGGRNRDELITGIGDDCAVVAPVPGHHWLITTDMLVDGVHFDRSWHPAYQLGRKCIAVNLSDIAAMGGDPAFALLSVAFPDSLEVDWITEWSRGVHSLLREFDCTLIGGDTVKSDTLTVNVTVFGAVRENRAILRSTAGPGESIFVSGHLGSAAAGLRIFQDRDRLPARAMRLARPFVERHLDPSPDVACGKILARSEMVTAMQDLSDGLATDLAHICRQSGIGAVVEAGSLPAQADLSELCALLACDMTELQVGGGDDYHLVFTVAPGRDEDLLRFVADNHGPELYRIGTTIPGAGVHIRTEAGLTDISFRGFQHAGGT